MAEMRSGDEGPKQSSKPRVGESGRTMGPAAATERFDVDLLGTLLASCRDEIDEVGEMRDEATELMELVGECWSVGQPEGGRLWRIKEADDGGWATMALSAVWMSCEA